MVDPEFPREKTTPEEGGQEYIGSIFGNTGILTLGELDNFDQKLKMEKKWTKSINNKIHKILRKNDSTFFLATTDQCFITLVLVLVLKCNMCIGRVMLNVHNQILSSVNIKPILHICLLQ